MKRSDEEHQQLEQEVSAAIAGEQLEKPDLAEEARKRLSPRHEIRIQSTYDPIVEETRKFRKIAKEVDDRYEKYLSKVPKK